MRFGNTKGEILVKKAFLGLIWGFLGQFGNQTPHPPIFGKVYPNKNWLFFGTFPLIKKDELADRKSVGLGLGLGGIEGDKYQLTSS